MAHGYLRYTPPGATTLALIAMIPLVTSVFVVVAPAALAQDVARGQKIWASKADCQQCHGWAGNGAGGLHSEGHAPSLRKTPLTRDEIRMTIQCGRPGSAMPHFDRFAYTDKRCYGMSKKDLGNQTPTRGATTLQPDEIDALADYVATKIKGAGAVTRAQCIEYFGGAASSCDIYPPQG